MEDKKVYLDIPQFSGENVPINTVAKVMKKDAQFIRIALQKGTLPIGVAIKKDENNQQFDYYISPLKLWEYTGFIYREDERKEVI